MASVNELYTVKQQEVLKWHFTHPNYFILINHGAVRTGKTFADNDIFLSDLVRIGQYAKSKGLVLPQYILAGASIGALERNVLNPIRQKYGMELRLNSFHAFELFGVMVCCFGHDDIGKINAITGMTAYGAYINEATKAKDEVLKQIIKRCSGDRGFQPHIVMDTNPDHPEHPVKKDYIDRADGKRIMAFHWRLADNTFLSPDYIENIKATTPSGVFTERDINGIWCTADGMVYRDFDPQIHIVEEPPSDFDSYYCGVDWGYEHKGAIVLFGERGDETYVIKEIVAQHRLIDWWRTAARKIVDEYGYGIPFYCDSARPDNIREFRNAGLWTVNADKEIAAGIECVAKGFKRGTLKLCADGLDRDKGLLKEIYGYVFDEKTGLPIKKNDDVMDALRYGYYSRNKRKKE